MEHDFNGHEVSGIHEVNGKNAIEFVQEAMDSFPCPNKSEMKS